MCVCRAAKETLACEDVGAERELRWGLCHSAGRRQVAAATTTTTTQDVTDRCVSEGRCFFHFLVTIWHKTKPVLSHFSLRLQTPARWFFKPANHESEGKKSAKCNKTKSTRDFFQFAHSFNHKPEFPSQEVSRFSWHLDVTVTLKRREFPFKSKNTKTRSERTVLCVLIQTSAS